MVIIRAENSFISIFLRLANIFELAGKFSIIYDSPDTFKIKIENEEEFLKLDKESFKFSTDELGDSFHLQDGNLMKNSTIILKNVYFLNVTSSPLIEAIVNDESEIENILKQNPYRGCVNEYGYTAFMLAVNSGNLDIVKLLHKYDMVEDLNMQSGTGTTSLMMATNSSEILRYLIENNLISESNLKDRDEDTNFERLLYPPLYIHSMLLILENNLEGNLIRQDALMDFSNTLLSRIQRSPNDKQLLRIRELMIEKGLFI